MTKHYPSNSKARFSDNIKALFSSFTQKKQAQININPLSNFEPLTKIQDENLKAKINDYWINEVANLRVNNSLMQHSHFVLERLPYQQLAMLASADDIINNAIETITREIFTQWGIIDIQSKNDEIDVIEIQDWLESRFKDLNLQDNLAKLARLSLVYGGALLFFNYDGMQDLEKPLILEKETNANKLKSLNIIEAWQVAPNEVNLNNPLKNDYMKPSKWYISGAGIIDNSRLYPLVFFEAPNIIKPMFNFLGISLTQFMQNKVKSAESIRQSLADIFLRFRTNIIRTPSLLSMDKETLKQRVELINMGINNFSTLLLSDTENFEQSITPISGLDKIYAQALETIASSARIPINKLFGQTPTGLNNSGLYDIANFYDTIKGYQINTIKPLIDKILKMLLNEKIEYREVEASFIFNPLEKLNDLELAQVKNTEADFYTKLIQAGIITQDEALQELQSKGLLSSNIEINDDSNDDDLFNELLENENNENLKNNDE